MTDPEKTIQLEARIRNLEMLLSQTIKTPLELLKEEIARNEANKSQYSIQHRLNERLKSVKLRPILATEEDEKNLAEERKRTDTILFELYQILDEVEPKQPVTEPPKNGHIKEGEPS
jgi:hypothetical protein